LAEEITGFLTHKRALGRKYLVEERSLRLLDRFLVERGIRTIETITAQLIEDFLVSRPRKSPRGYNHLLGVVRRLLDWLVEQGVLDRSPLTARPRRQTRQRIPYLFDSAQAKKLLEIAGNLPSNPAAPLRGPTYRTIFALLYGLGLRVGEVSRLCPKDVDFNRDLLIIRMTKFSKSRLVPFGPRMANLLREYIRLREERWGTLDQEWPLFSFNKDRPINPATTSVAFQHVVSMLNIEVPPGVSHPHLHDLRHSFAVGTLLRWYRNGIDPSARLLHLSTLLGHVNPTSTAVYLTITEDLLKEGNRRFEDFAMPVLKEVRR